MRVLILGGTGSIGRELTTALRSEGHVVSITGRSTNHAKSLDARDGEQKFVSSLLKICTSEQPEIIISALADGVSPERRQLLTISNSEIDAWIKSAVDRFKTPLIFLKSSLKMVSETDFLYADWNPQILEGSRSFVLNLPKVSIRSYRPGIFESVLIEALDQGEVPPVDESRWRDWTSTQEVIRVLSKFVSEVARMRDFHGVDKIIRCRSIEVPNTLVVEMCRAVTAQPQEQFRSNYSLFNNFSSRIPPEYSEHQLDILQEMYEDFYLFVDSYRRIRV